MREHKITFSGVILGIIFIIIMLATVIKIMITVKLPK